MDDDRQLRARATLHPAFHRGEVDRRLFGSFVEHMGRCVYGGIFEPDHPSADTSGFRTDVEALVRQLGTTLVRYPGGNFVSGYHWRDGIGPVEQRPARLDLAWRSIESNRIGTDEFLPWARRLGLEPMMAVNLGTAGVAEAAQLVEYCNVASGTAWSDLRRRHGQQASHDIRLWCLGNEMDGRWQIGHQSADDYGKLAAAAGRAMRRVDPGIELVACGSSHREMATFGSWETTVLEHTADVVDHLSMHAYYDGQQDRADFVASGWAMDRSIGDVTATIDAVLARTGSSRRIDIAFDEWNVWSSGPGPSPSTRERIETAPQISEDPYQSLDAVVLGDLLISLLNHADRVRVACLSLLVNVSAPITTVPGGPALRQTTFHPMALTTALARGRSLVVALEADSVVSPRHGDLPAVGVAATHDPGTGRLAVFLVNRADRPVDLVLDIPSLATTSVDGHRVVADLHGRPVGPGADAAEPGPPTATAVTDTGVSTVLPPYSWTALHLETEHR